MTSFVPNLRPMEMYDGNEYHFQDRDINRAGEARLRDPSFLQGIEVPENTNQQDWVPCTLTEEIKRILTPRDGKVSHVSFGSWENWRVLTLIKRSRPNETTHYKVAIQQKDTNKVLLYFASNHAQSENKKYPSVLDGWFVFHSDVVAPTIFWSDLQSRLQ